MDTIPHTPRRDETRRTSSLFTKDRLVRTPVGGEKARRFEEGNVDRAWEREGGKEGGIGG